MPLDGDAAGTFGRVPTDLRTWHQWVCWKYGTGPTGKPTKLPIQARNGQLASVTDPATWDTFEAVVAAAGSELWGAHGIGFVFGPDDPYAGIDLDVNEDGGSKELKEAHDKVLAAFPSYTEVSPSGRGLHVIVRGSIQGARKHGVEAYSTERFFTVTGQVDRDLPIITADKDALAELQEALAPARTALSFLSTVPQTVPDHVIVERMRAAKNGEKAMRLAAGDASALDGSDRSGSAIDMALVNCIAFHTQCVPQIERLWLESPHGQNPKRARKLARVPYRMQTIRRALDRAVPPVDFTALQAKWEAQRASEAAPTDAGEEAPMAPQADLAPRQPCRTAAASNPYNLPPGLMGRIANFIYDAAPRQVHEIALAAAIGWLAGHAGRAYNIKGTGLNVYLAMIASSGAGKEAISSGYNRLLKATSSIAGAKDFIGPAQFASGVSLVRHVERHPSSVSVVGEFGHWLSDMTAIKPSAIRAAIKTELTLMFTKSGKHGVYRPTVYSDSTKDIPEIQEPAFSLVGESTPDTFYASVTDRAIRDGFIPRFIVIEYEGDNRYENENAPYAALPPELAEEIRQFVAHCVASNVPIKATNNSGAGVAIEPRSPINVELAYDVAESARAFSKMCVDRSNEWKNLNNEGLSNIWSRVNLNVLKLAGLVAVGCNAHSPVVDAAAFDWACNLVLFSVDKITGKITSGEVAGSDDQKQYAKALEALRGLRSVDPTKSRKAYRISPFMQANGLISASWLNMRLGGIACFRDQFNSSAAAVNRVRARLIEDGVLTLVVKYSEDERAQHGIPGTCYWVNQALTDQPP